MLKLCWIGFHRWQYGPDVAGEKSGERHCTVCPKEQIFWSHPGEFGRFMSPKDIRYGDGKGGLGRYVNRR